MNVEPASFESMLPVVLNEARRRRIALALVFAGVALAALVLGLLWPRKYMASTTILAQESSIITPLMEGAATPTANATRAGMARAVVFSRKVLDQILITGGWMASHPSPAEQDRIIQGIRGRTTVNFSHDNLITISYYDSVPKRTYDVTREFAQLFITESLASKKRESRDAFDFINNEVESYRAKLTSAETKLMDYRQGNADARVGSVVDTNNHISQLRTQIENARLDLMEKRSQAASLSAQLGGQSEVNTVQTTGGVYQVQLANLQAQLNKLLLTYTDEYPDVIRIRHQIEDLRQQLAQDEKRKEASRAAGQASTLDNNAQFNPLYQQLQSQLSAVRAGSAAIEARINESNTLLQSELQRSNRIASADMVTAELTRDYNVNRDVYQDLLNRREKARVSMNLDSQHQGLTFLVQNPAVMPLNPSGLRFMHFAIGGGLLALAIPLGLLFGIARVDPRVRSTEQLKRLTGLTVLATIPFYPTPQDRRREQQRNGLMVIIVAGVVLVYAILFWLKLRGLA
ncbi:MAG: XrtA system polysaccharide chain length determinant [Rhodanobacter sp.]|jgi:polysaccharide chain length determinant protein (PEP-CTERM system associated)